MSEIDVVRAAMAEAMRAKDKARKDSLSILLSALKNAQIDRRKPLIEAKENATVKKEIKQTQETYDLALADREDVRRDAVARLAVYREFAPEDMNVEQIREIIASVLEKLGLAPPTVKDKGTIMKVLMPGVRSKADGETANETLTSILNQRRGILKMDYRKETEGFTGNHREDTIEDICKFYRINSEKTPYTEGKPYGERTSETLQAALPMAEGYGFSITGYNNYMGTVDLDDKENQLDILAHLDVVPAGEEWIETPAYELIVKDGKLFGRGIADGKDPAVTALYTMRAVKELGIPLNRSVRLVLGTDEECGSSDIAYYYDREKETPMTFSSDTEFPVTNVEEGHLEGHFYAEFKAPEAVPRLVKAEADIKANVVPGKAKVTMEGTDLTTLGTLAEEIRAETGISFDFEDNFPVFRITAQRKGAHASTPQGGKNALTGLLLYLAHLPLAECGQMGVVKALVELLPHGDTCGKAVGTTMEDGLSGALTLAFSMLTVPSDSLESIFDSRCPICSNEDNVLRTVKKNMANKGVTLENETMVPPHHVDENSRSVKTLLTCHEECTGLQGSCESASGGICVHYLKNGAAFGATPSDIDNRIHGADEFAVVDGPVINAKMFVQTIVKLYRRPGVK